MSDSIMEDTLRCNETLKDPLAIKTKVCQAELEKDYKYYACTHLKFIYHEQKQTPEDTDEVPTPPSVSPDDDMVDLALLSDKFKKTSITGVKGGAPETKKRVIKLKRKKILSGKKCFELGIVYKKVNGKMGVRKFRVAKVADLDKFQEENLTEEMQQKYGKILVDHNKFCLETFEKCGGFFNKKFWDINIRWGLGASYDANLLNVDQFLTNHYTKQ